MDFDSAAFASSTSNERVALCRAFAAEAAVFAEDASGSSREGFAALVRAWSVLAAEIEKLKDGVQ